MRPGSRLCSASRAASSVDGIRAASSSAPSPPRRSASLGARHFVYEAGISGELERIRGVVNLDCVAHGERLELLGSPAELRTLAEEFARDLGLTERYHVRVEDTKAGVDSVPFAQEDVPALSIVHFPYPEYHLPSERLELVDERRLADSVDLAVALVESQLERPVASAA